MSAPLCSCSPLAESCGLIADGSTGNAIIACQASSDTKMVRAGESGEGGHKPWTGEAQAESYTVAERAIATALT